MSDYATFLERKRREFGGCGVAPSSVPETLYPFQSRLVRWALRRGRAAIFADTGLGKTLMQVAWAAQVPGRVLILAPLCVAHQTIQEARKIGIEVGLHVGSGVRIEVTNYERLHHVRPIDYRGVVLDESSILKSLDGKTRTKLIGMFQRTPMRLCCTATPAPNDVTELANHAEFLGMMTRAEMLATWFVHISDASARAGWRLKRHAREAFARWLTSWGRFVRRPSDLGDEDGPFTLPPLHVSEHVVRGIDTGTLFPEMGLGGIRGRQEARRATVEARADLSASLVDGEPSLVWCGLNAEQEAMESRLDGTAVSISGADEEADKEQKLLRFLEGGTTLITKPRIAGFGLNFQHVSAMCFVGLSDSFESYYQAVRRVWRFGQTRPVRVRIVVSDTERGVSQNVARKQREHEAMCESMVEAVRDMERDNDD